MFQGRLHEVEVGFNKVGFDGALKNLFEFKILLDVLFDMILMEICYVTTMRFMMTRMRVMMTSSIEISLSIMILMSTFH